MKSLRSTAVVVTAVVALGPALVASQANADDGSTTSPTASPTATPTVAQTETNQTTPTSKGWHPKVGVRFNEPRRKKTSHRINKYIRNGIKNTKKGQQIRMVTWNFSSNLFSNDLIRAHKRGVSVRIIMANGLAKNQSRSGPFARTRDALAKGNKKRSQGMTSWFQTCKNSCRGKEGIQHGKWFMFSRTGGVDKVVMSTSANLTDAAAYNQWNDLLTIANKAGVWKNWTKIFNQMSRDKKVKHPFYTFRDGSYQGWFQPQVGSMKKHNVIRLLNTVKCKGARGTTGINGHTRILVSQAVFNGRPGTAIATKLHNLKNSGCKVKLVYGVLNRNSAAQLANIRRKTILEDTNDDGFVDRYLHMKAMTISGNVGGDRTGHVVYQGSSNWSGMSTLSDEQGFIVKSKKLEERYSKEIMYLFKNPPPQGLNLTKEIIIRKKAGQDPFAQIREEMGMGTMQPDF